MSDTRSDSHQSLLPAEWRVQLPVFEGPLDLLLQLVKINEVEITDIPVARVCDQFHAYLALMEELDLDIAGEYIYEAALLIQLKARMLLPRPRTDDDQVEEEDPRQELVQRLLEYRRLKEAAQALAEVSNVRLGLWTRTAKRPTLELDEGDALEIGDVSLFDLLKVFRGVLRRYEEEHPPPLRFRGETFSVRSQMERLLARLAGGRPVDLEDDLLALSCRAEAIAAFLAILELGKLQAIRIQRAGESVLLYRTTREVERSDLEAVQG